MVRQYYIITVTSPTKLKSLIQYLDTYPLFSSKLLNYLDFRKCVQMMLGNEHLTAEGRTKIKALKAGMNNKRTYYNWPRSGFLNFLIIRLLNYLSEKLLYCHCPIIFVRKSMNSVNCKKVLHNNKYLFNSND